MADCVASNESASELFPYPGKVKSAVWKYFMFRKKRDDLPPQRSNLDMTSVICTLCKKSYANKGNTTNLQFHLDSHHKLNATSLATSKVQTQPKIDQFGKGASGQYCVPGRFSKARQIEVDDALMKLMIAKVLPLSLVENDKFRDFVRLLEPRYEVPGRKVLLKGLEKKKQFIENQIRTDLKDCEDISITHDGWTSCNTESYSTVTAHYIDKNWNLKSVSLSTKKTVGSQTSENIAQDLDSVKHAWNLPTCIAVSDNAANEKKAFELLNWLRFGCYGHRVNLVVRNSLTGNSVARLIGKGRKLVSFFHQSSSANDLLLAKQRLLLSDEQSQRSLKLLLDVPTRWNSTYTMLERLNKLLPGIVATASDPSASKSITDSIKNYSYNFEEQTLSENLVHLLQPFLKATESVSSETTPTMQKIMPILLALERAVTVKDDDCDIIKSVKLKMASELEKRTQDTDLALLACVLNPFTRHLRFLDVPSQSRAVQLLEEKALELTSCIKVKQEAIDDKKSLPTLPVAPDEISDSIPNFPEAPDALIPIEIDNDMNNNEPAKKIKLEQNLSHTDDWLEDVIFVGETVEPVVDKVKLEISRYLGSNISENEKTLSILDWWRQNELFFPKLSVLAKRYLCVPVSSIPSERIFSLCGSVVSKKRSRISHNNVDLIVFLHKNMASFWN